ncbi:MAG TPA: peptidylprolyl isomerase [Planctomycetota bacterium]|nr:peptidylprolyl isomerase [Planctomycetota bacterium]
MQIARHTVATLTYRLTDDSGALIDASEEGQPLAYIHGTRSLIPGLEQALEGHSSGDVLKLRLPPELAYGERDEELIHQVSRHELPAEAEIAVGVQFHAEGEDGLHILTVVGIEGDSVRLDANHPLAGKALNFDVSVVSVRAATAEELTHGHAHGQGGHHH